MKEKVLLVVRNILVKMMDCIEESLDSMVIAKGKQVIYVFEVTILFLVVAIFCDVYDKACFISWQEAGVAVLQMGLVCCVNRVNKVQVDSVLDFIMQKQRKKGDESGGK